jgi:hypothetical protein
MLEAIFGGKCIIVQFLGTEKGGKVLNAVPKYREQRRREKI